MGERERKRRYVEGGKRGETKRERREISGKLHTGEKIVEINFSKYSKVTESEAA